MDHDLSFVRLEMGIPTNFWQRQVHVNHQSPWLVQETVIVPDSLPFGGTLCHDPVPVAFEVHVHDTVIVPVPNAHPFVPQCHVGEAFTVTLFQDEPILALLLWWLP